MHWFLDPIQKHYFDFEGRVGRQEFWMFVLFIFGINIVLNIVHAELLGMIVSVALFLPNISIAARRLHDTGRSGWWQLIGLIPILGWIILIVWLAEETKPADNEYGAPAVPKEGVNTAAATPAAATPVTSESATPASEGGEPLPEQQS